MSEMDRERSGSFGTESRQGPTKELTLGRQARASSGRQRVQILPRSGWLVLALCLFPSVATVSSGLPQAANLQGQTPPLGEFQSLCAQSKQRENPFYSDNNLRRLQARLGQPFAQPISEVETRGRLAFEYVRIGDFRNAIDQTQQALELLDRHQIRAPGLWGFLKELSGNAHFQAAEDQNCLQLHNHASCLLPLAAAAVHEEPASAKAAARSFAEVLERNPNRVSARWLLNLATLLAGSDPSDLPASQRLPKNAFATGATDLEPWQNLGPRLFQAAPDLAGGAVVDDFDGDGLLDLISSSMDPCAPIIAHQGVRNEDGVLSFRETTGGWGLSTQLGGLNLIHADFDNDGHLDLLVLRGAWFGKEGRIRNSLLRNAIQEGRGFEDVTVSVGLAYPAFPTQSAAVADFDGDGDLDLAVANEARDVVIDPSQASNSVTNGHPFQLFLNRVRDQENDEGSNGPQLSFVDVTRRVGLHDTSFTKSVSWGDIDNDGDPDLLLSNFGPNRLFRNDSEDGVRRRFTEITDTAKVGGRDRRTFASWFFDFDQDGDQDIFVASYNVPADVVAGSYLGLQLQAEDWASRPDRLRSNPMLFRNDGLSATGTVVFTDVSSSVGLDRPILAMGANFADFNNDSFPDIYLGTGMPDFTAIHPNVSLLNQAGQQFVDVSFDLGMAHLQKGHGVAFGDIDHDGDIDLFHQLGGAFPYDRFPNALFVNPLMQSAHTRAWVVLQLEGAQDNHYGVGARITLKVIGPQGQRTVSRTVGTGGSFGSSTHRSHVGLDDAETIESIAVRWPSGATETYPGGEINRYYWLLQGSGELRPLDMPKLKWR